MMAGPQLCLNAKLRARIYVHNNKLVGIAEEESQDWVDQFAANVASFK